MTTPGDNEEEVLEKISRERFIQLGTALGVGAACASLAACGGGASTGSGNSGGGNSGEGDSGGGNSGKGKSGGGNSDGGNAGNGTSGSGKSGKDKSGGDDSGGGKAGDGGEKDSPKQAASSGGPAIASESEVAPGSAVTFKDAGSPAVLVHLDNGDFVAYSAVCTHQGCTVAYNNGQLACPCHGSLFDPANGADVIAGPATSPLPEIPVKVEGGDIVKA